MFKGSTAATEKHHAYTLQEGKSRSPTAGRKPLGVNPCRTASAEETCFPARWPAPND